MRKIKKAVEINQTAFYEGGYDFRYLTMKIFPASTFLPFCNT